MDGPFASMNFKMANLELWPEITHCYSQLLMSFKERTLDTKLEGPQKEKTHILPFMQGQGHTQYVQYSYNHAQYYDYHIAGFCWEILFMSEPQVFKGMKFCAWSMP